MDGNLEKLFAVLQANLRPNGYKLEESAYDRVSNLLNTKTRTFVNKIKAEDNRNNNRNQAGSPSFAYSVLSDVKENCEKKIARRTKQKRDYS